MRILIFGAGAVGLGISSFLLQAGQSLDILGRPGTVLSLKAHGLKRTGIFGGFHAAKEPASPASASASRRPSASPRGERFGCLEALDELNPTPYDFILVCVKSPDSRQAARQLARHKEIYNRRTRIVLVQNGWGNAEIFAEHFPHDQIYNARVITGFTRHGLSEVEVTVHADAVRIGSLFTQELKSITPLARLIDQGGLPCAVTEEIGKFLWDKMLYNCALNPLGGILNVPYGALGERPRTREMMNTIIQEVYEVMHRAGYESHWPTPEAYQEKFYNDFLPSTYAHQSSMLMDLRAGKTTEIEAMTGAVLHLAQQYAIDVPVNTRVYKMVKLLEAQGSPGTIL